MNKQIVIFLLFIILSMNYFISCSPKEEKTDSYYFSALQKIENGEKEEAVSSRLLREDTDAKEDETKAETTERRATATNKKNSE